MHYGLIEGLVIVNLKQNHILFGLWSKPTLSLYILFCSLGIIHRVTAWYNFNLHIIRTLQIKILLLQIFYQCQIRAAVSNK